MALRITIKEIGDVSVVSLNGRVVLGEASNKLRESVRGLLAGDKSKIVLDLEDVTYIDSAGLGVLVEAQNSARNRGATLKLSGLGMKFQELLQITKLVTVFDVFESVPVAVKSFSTNFGWFLLQKAW